MKLSVIGGCGVRSPLMVGAIAKRAARLGIDELALYDIDPRKRAVFIPLIRHQLDVLASPVKVVDCLRPEEALEGAGAVITTIRPGFEEGRVQDELVPLSHNVIGQETTGPGGFAMACRSIPAILGYAETFFRSNPSGWLINFTNPAGLVTQALQDGGFDRSVGICDSAHGPAVHAADFFKEPFDVVRNRVWGLNHLSWTDRVYVRGVDRLPELLASDTFLHRSQPYFSREEVRNAGMLFNEYLYYFYHTAKAVQELRAETETRGQQVLRLNRDLLAGLERRLSAGEAAAALDDYFAYQHERTGSYMKYARTEDRYLPRDEEEGYAGVALDLLTALQGEGEHRMALSAPNRGALPFLDDGDVVEISCTIDHGKIAPVAIGDVPAPQKELISRVKQYERLTVQAVGKRSLATAQSALETNPLVPDAAAAAAILDGYRHAHATTFDTWR